MRVFLRGIAHANYLTTEFTEHTERVGILNFTLCVLSGLCGLNSVRNFFPKKTRTWREIFKILLHVIDYQFIISYFMMRHGDG